MVLGKVQLFILLVEVFGATQVRKEFALYYFLLVLVTLVVFGIIV